MPSSLPDTPTAGCVGLALWWIPIRPAGGRCFSVPKMPLLTERGFDPDGSDIALATGLEGHGTRGLCAPRVSLCIRQVAPDSGGPATG